MKNNVETMSKTEVHSRQIPCNKCRILVVDDEIRNLFRQLLKLEMPDYRLNIAVNGAEAIEMFRHNHHAMLLLDLRMAVMDGEKAFAAIETLCAEQNWEMPAVIFCTGYDPTPKVREIIAKDPRHCLLSKPVPNDILLETIKAHLPK